MQIEEEDNYWFVDIYPGRNKVLSKNVNDNIVDIGYDEESKEYFVKGVHYNKNTHNIDDVMEKAKKIYYQAKTINVPKMEGTPSKKECTICKGLNRIKQLDSWSSSSEIEHAYSNVDYTNSSASFSPLLLKLIIDLPSRLFLTPMGRKLSSAFLLLLSNLLKDQVGNKAEKKSIENFMDQLIKDITIDKRELPYLYNNLLNISKGLQQGDLSLISSAIIKNPEATKKYLSSLVPPSDEEKKKKKKTSSRKFI